MNRTHHTLRTCLLVVAALAVPWLLPAQGAGPLRRVFPGYPEYMKEAGIERVLQVKFKVNRAGMVTDAALVDADKDSNPEMFFMGTLLDAVWQWRYPPSPRPREIQLRFTYRIEVSEVLPDDYVIFSPPSDVQIVAVKRPPARTGAGASASPGGAANAPGENGVRRKSPSSRTVSQRTAEPWRQEVLGHEEFFILLHSHLPKEIIFERELLICRL